MRVTAQHCCPREGGLHAHLRSLQPPGCGSWFQQPLDPHGAHRGAPQLSMINRSRGSPSEPPGLGAGQPCPLHPPWSAYPVGIRGPSRASKHIPGNCRLYLTSEMISGGSCRARESQEGERQAVAAEDPGLTGQGTPFRPAHLQARTYSQDTPTCRAKGRRVTNLRRALGTAPWNLQATRSAAGTSAGFSPRLLPQSRGHPGKWVTCLLWHLILSQECSESPQRSEARMTKETRVLF